MSWQRKSLDRLLAIIANLDSGLGLLMEVDRLQPKPLLLQRERQQALWRALNDLLDKERQELLERLENAWSWSEVHSERWHFFVGLLFGARDER